MLIQVETLRQNIFESIFHTVHLLRNFWTFCKPFFSNEATNFDDKVILAEIIVSKNVEIAAHFINYFKDITKGLKCFFSDKMSNDPLVKVIRKYENNPSIMKIKSSFEKA